MVVLVLGQELPTFTRRKVERLRVQAMECRSLARMIDFRPDRERMLDMARRLDVEATYLEVGTPLEAPNCP